MAFSYATRALSGGATKEWRPQHNPNNPDPLLTQTLQVFEPGDVAYIKFLESYRISLPNGEWVQRLLKQVSRELVTVTTHIGEAFSLFDLNGDGLIQAPELRERISDMIPESSSAALYALMRTMDKNQDNRISLQEFVERFKPSFMRAVVYHGPNAALVQKAVTKLGRSVLREESFCEKLCGEGGWSVDQAAFALKQFLPELTEAELASVVDFLDVDGDGKIIPSELQAAFEAVDGNDQANQEWQHELERTAAELIHKCQHVLKPGLRAFDPHNTGLIDREDLSFALESLAQLASKMDGGPQLDRHAIKALIADLESDPSGLVDYQSWIKGFQVEVDLVW